MWYMTETTNFNSVRKADVLNAKTAIGAKIAAGNKQYFSGTVLKIGQKFDSNGFLIPEYARVDGVWSPVDKYQ